LTAQALPGVESEDYASAPPPAQAEQISPELRKKTFDEVWRTVKEKHFDPNLGGVDWDKVRGDYQGRVLSATDDGEFYRMLNEMLATLPFSHLRVFTRDEVGQPTSLAAAGGIDIRVIDGAATMTRIEPDSPASRSGLHPGFVITQVDGVATAALFDSVTTDRTALRRGADLRQAVLKRMRGQPGASFRIRYLDALNSEHEVVLKREAPGKGRPGGEQAYDFDIESKTLDRGIGYLRFNGFDPRVEKTLVAAVQSMRDAPGMIIDLRGNHGGDDSVMSKLAEQLLNKPAVFCVVRTRKGVEQIRIKPGGKVYTGQVVILIDGTSLSSAEQFAAPMQELGRATIIGEKTPGIDLDASIKKLPTGAYLLYVEGEPRTPNGVVIEGRGVTPDIPVSLTRDSLLKGVDQQLKAAIASINKLPR
jgi:carboxyl-terminal processing protease